MRQGGRGAGAPPARSLEPPNPLKTSRPPPPPRSYKTEREWQVGHLDVADGREDRDALNLV